MLLIRDCKNYRMVRRLMVCSFLIVFLVNCSSTLGPVEGYVTSVEVRSITEIRSFTLNRSDGDTIHFTAETGMFDLSTGIAVTPSHLRDHMLLGQPVLVRYYEHDDVLIAISIEDVR